MNSQHDFPAHLNIWHLIAPSIGVITDFMQLLCGKMSCDFFPKKIYFLIGEEEFCGEIFFFVYWRASFNC
jgi:hypothetical protein